MNPPRTIRLGHPDSTSLHARREIEAGTIRAADGPVLFTAETQSAGIGRFARPWASPEGGLWCTLAWPLGDDGAEVLDGLGLRMGVACLGFVRGLVGSAREAEVMLKWPNDILLGGRKVLGVLGEHIRAGTRGWAVVGAGLNANFDAERLPENVRPGATTLRTALHRDIDLEAATADLAARLSAALVRHGVPRETLALARAALTGVGEEAPVTLPDGARAAARLTGLDERGEAVFGPTV